MKCLINQTKEIFRNKKILIIITMINKINTLKNHKIITPKNHIQMILFYKNKEKILMIFIINKINTIYMNKNNQSNYNKKMTILIKKFDNYNTKKVFQNKKTIRSKEK